MSYTQAPVFFLGHPCTVTQLLHSLFALDEERFIFYDTFMDGFTYFSYSLNIFKSSYLLGYCLKQDQWIILNYIYI